MANIWKILPKIPQVIQDVQDLAGLLLKMQADPEFKKAIAKSPSLRAQSEAISREARAIQEAFK